MKSTASRGRPCRSVLLTVLALASTPLGARCDVELPLVFGSGMVLQRDVPVAVWGRAEPGEEVAVSIGGCSRRTEAGLDGAWSVRLDPFAAGGPHTLVVEGANRLIFEDVLFGEVWLGAGQSNMGLPVEDCAPGAEDLVRRPALRLFQQLSLPSAQAEWRGSGAWTECRPESVRVFSGALFHFGRTLREELDVPVGLIQASVGGTRIQCWIDRAALLADPRLAPNALAHIEEYEAFDIARERQLYRKELAAWKARRATPSSSATEGEKSGRPRNRVEFHDRIGNVGELFNALIAPIIPYTIRGVVWYQGESNVYEAELYQAQLTLLVNDWRARWGCADLPFGWVQLANFCEGGRADWPRVREAMRCCLSLPSTGMAVAIDLGLPRNIHPPNKRAVGERLAAWALGDVYGLDVATSGPLFTSHDVDGSRVTVRFDHVDGGLVVRGDELRGFELAGADGIWHAARARVEDDTVVVSTRRVPRPANVRYAWYSNPACTLYNAAGLPASPFTSE